MEGGSPVWYAEHVEQLDESSAVRGKVIALTGCTSGVALHAAVAAAALGARAVLLLNRPSERARAAESSVRAAAAPGCYVRTVLCDLTRLRSVRAAAAELANLLGPADVAGTPCADDAGADASIDAVGKVRTGSGADGTEAGAAEPGEASRGVASLAPFAPPAPTAPLAPALQPLAGCGLDVLACAGAVAPSAEAITADGFDVQLQVNFLSHFTLIGECLPLLTRAAERSGHAARIVLLTSLLRYWPPLPLQPTFFGQLCRREQLGGDSTDLARAGGAWRRHQQSKLACAVLAAALTERLALAAAAAAAAAAGGPAGACTPRAPVLALTADPGTLDPVLLLSPDEADAPAGVTAGVPGSAVRAPAPARAGGAGRGCCGGAARGWCARLFAQPVEDAALPLLMACFDESAVPGGHFCPRGRTRGPPMQFVRGAGGLADAPWPVRLVARAAGSGGAAVARNDAARARERALLWALGESAVGPFGGGGGTLRAHPARAAELAGAKAAGGGARAPRGGVPAIAVDDAGGDDVRGCGEEPSAVGAALDVLLPPTLRRASARAAGARSRSHSRRPSARASGAGGGGGDDDAGAPAGVRGDGGGNGGAAPRARAARLELL
ncbi:hypothetical protein KFE25_004450 [Diacronema lutheri]|uniref:Oxidoreductase n=1 Tax=Diacronema lutheri TaxID=2081491 RepID=A0A8J5XFZ8_DIALT|nr:hypothetical protein KFE25_004450 [Diacronema lutheri]